MCWTVHYRLKPATPDDVPWLESLRRSVYRDLFIATWGRWDEVRHIRHCAECWERGNIYTVDLDGERIGMIQLHDYPDRLEIGEIQIQPSHQCQGVGTRLLQDVLARAHAQQKKVSLATGLKNHRAVRLYERLGFRCVSRSDTHIQMESPNDRTTAAFSIRRARAGDAALIRGMRIASLTDAPYAFGEKLSNVLAQSEQSFEEDARRHGTSEESTSFFLFSGNEPIGIIGAFFEQSGHRRAFICALWVNPRSRGTSAASLLVSTATDWLSDRGANSVFAWVANDNARALAFYRKAGFVVTSEIQPLPSDPSRLETLFRYDREAKSRNAQ